MGLLQEKYQTDFPEPRQSHDWKSSSSARRKKSSPEYLNCLPPGDNIEDQQLTDQPAFPRVMSGESDVSKDFSVSAAKEGYTRRLMSPVADAYTGEHVDTFYGEKKVDGETGFAERGNVLDRI